MSTQGPLPAGCTSYAKDIFPKFIPDDVAHMAARGLDLNVYEDVRDNAGEILNRLKHKDPKKMMPPPPRGPWKPEWIECFEQWIKNGKQP